MTGVYLDLRRLPRVYEARYRLDLGGAFQHRWVVNEPRLGKAWETAFLSYDEQPTPAMLRDVETALRRVLVA